MSVQPIREPRPGDLLGAYSLERWEDPVIENCGHHVMSEYVENWWLPIIGPTSLFLLRRLEYLTPSTGPIATTDLAWSLGASQTLSRNSILARTVNRLVHFSLLRVHAGIIYVPSHLPPLTQRQISRFPHHIAALYAIEEQLRIQNRSSVTTNV